MQCINRKLNMELREISLQAKLEKMLHKLPRWPLTTFGTALLVLFLAGVAFGVYQWLSCLMLRGLL